MMMREHAQPYEPTTSTAGARLPVVSLAVTLSVFAGAACDRSPVATPSEPPTQGHEGDADSGVGRVSEVLPSKARYLPSETAELTATVHAGSERFAGPVLLQVHHRGEVVHEETLRVALDADAVDTVRFTWTPPATDFTGYLAVVRVSETLQTTAIDVSSSPYVFPRYGFLSEFGRLDPAEREARVRTLGQRYMVNMLQFYDWHWRHEQLIRFDGNAVAATWTDLFDRTTEFAGVQNYIDVAHDLNMSALAYVMIYAAREGYAELSPVSPSWGIFSSPAAQDQLNVSFGDGRFLFLFDPGNREWQDYIISQYVDAVTFGNFDGVHIDQLGPRYDVYRADSTPVDLPTTFPDFLRATKERLIAIAPERSACVFNLVDGAVAGWAVAEVTTAGACDVQYSEVWFQTNTYRDLQLYIEYLRQLGGGSAVVLAAYSQYGEQVGPVYEAERAAVLDGVGVASNHQGYSGPGFVDRFDAPGDRITWEVTVADGTNVTLAFRYANATGQAATRQLLVDGNPVVRLSFPSDGQWSTWFDAPYFQLELSAGSHTVTLAHDADDVGAINVDHLRLSSFSESAVRLADAVMFASGATHIELGDDEQSLAHEFFPNRSKSLTPELRRALRSYYVFAAAYENLLFGSDVLPVLDVERLSLPSGQQLARSGTGIVYPIVRRSPGLELIHLVNLIGASDDLWRNAGDPPVPQENVKVRWYPEGDRVADSAFWASPDLDGGAPHALELVRGEDADGAYIEVELPRLEYWDMIAVRTRPAP